MNLQDDDFTLFGAPRQFAQDRGALDARWKALQRQAHPDNFSADTGAAQRLAMQWSARINEAYNRLKKPLSRAAYLCELAGFAIQAHSNTAMPGAFLMQQMQWREALDEAASAADLAALQDEVDQALRQVQQRCATLLDAQQDYAAAVQAVREWMFIEKFARDVEQRADTGAF